MLQQSQASLLQSKRRTATPKDEEEHKQQQFQAPSSSTFSSVKLNKDPSLRSVALTKNDPSFRSISSFSKKSETLLSPHNSVFQALQNPDLDLNLSQYNGNINNSFDKQRLLGYQNNEFSITSWQSISSCLSGDSQQDPLRDQSPQLPQKTLASIPPPSTRALFTNPFAATGQTSFSNSIDSNGNKMAGSYNFVSRNRSPNVGSILSSSDNDDRLLDDLNIGFQEGTNSHRVIVFDSESDDSGTDDDEYTVDSSTIIPSFVMPRVSIPSLGGTTKTGLGQSDSMAHDDNIIKVQVVGACNNLLVERLNSYRKILKGVEFYTSNQSEPHLLLLLVNQENYLLPSLINKPYIPIIVQDDKNGNYSDLLNRLFKGLMVCEPLVLTSINDDIMMLIDFLNNLEKVANFEAILRGSIGSMGSSLKLNTINSILMSKNNSSSVYKRRVGSSTIKSQRNRSRSNSSTSNTSSSDSSKISKKKKSPKEIRHLKAKLMLGITFGVVSLTIVLIWRELTTADSNYIEQPKLPGLSVQSSSISTPSRSLSSSISSINSPPMTSPKADSGKYSIFLDSEAPFEMFSVDELLLSKFDEVSTELSRLGKFLITESFMLIERAKLALVHLMNLLS